MSIGANIARFRVAKRMNQAELSEKINIHSVTLSNYENEKRDIKSKDLQKIADALQCSVSDLLNPPASSESTRTSA